MKTLEKNTTLSQFSVYCGTYQKYNSGSLYGEWIDLSDFSDIDSFYEYCAELHSDEQDPEFMFQDWESPVDGLISESHIDEKIFEYAEMNEYDFEIYLAYVDAVGEEYATPQEAQDSYVGFGYFDEYCYDYFNEKYGDNPLMEYVDWDHVEREMRMNYSFGELNGVEYWFLNYIN